MIETSCPFCAHTFFIKRDTLVLSSMNSLIMERLWDRTYFSHLCSNCHRLFYLTYPFLLKNPDKGYCLVLSNQNHFDTFEGEGHVVVTKSVPQFYLAFRLLEEELNFSIVLKKKQALEKRLNASVFFEKYDTLNQCLWFECDGELKAVLLTKEEAKQIKTVYNKK